MEKIFPFTIQRLKALPTPPKGKRFHFYDEKVPGFCVIVTHTGNKSYYLYKKVMERAERFFIGKVNTMLLSEAKVEATRLNLEIARGKNPQEAIRARNAEPTLAEFYQEFRIRHLVPYRRPLTIREYDRQFANYLKRWHRRPLSALSRGDIQRLHSGIGNKQGPIIANRVLALLSAILGKAKSWGVITGDNPAQGVERFPERSRERFLNGDELHRFFAALNEESNITARDCLWLCLLTGARRGNVQSMAWKDVDFENSTWRIPQTKSGKTLTLPLTEKAIEILAKRMDEQTHPSWVFPGNGKSGHIVELKTVWARILKRAEISDLRIHDLRRTSGSWQAITGSSLPVIGKSLGHTTSSATQVYSRLTQDPVRESLERAQAAMFSKDGKVAPIKKRG